jgi:VWFA-related protein
VPQEQEIPRPSYDVSVVVTTIDVVVTDKQGKRVTGLKPGNFKIFEDDLPQKLTNFYEVQGLEVRAYSPDPERGQLSAPAKVAVEPRLRPMKTIVFYFDNKQLNPMSRNKSIEKIETFIRNTISAEKGTQGMVVCLDNNLEVLQGPTSNPGSLLRAMDEVKDMTGQSILVTRQREETLQEIRRLSSDSARSTRYQDADSALGYARNYVDSRQNEILFSLKALNAFLNFLVGVEGKKIVLYVSESLSLNPAEDVYGYLDQAFPTSNARVESLNYDITADFKELTARCNANEVTLYPINAKSFSTTISTADQASDLSISLRGSGMVRTEARANAEALNLMASDTGGRAILDSQAIEEGLASVAGDLEYYYSLGYKSPYTQDNRYRTLRVELADTAPDYRVRVRKGYIRLAHEEKIKESVFYRLFTEGRYNPLEVIVQTLPLKPLPGTDKQQLTLKLLIPIRKLMLSPEGDFYSGRIRVYLALKDRNNEISPCYLLSHDVKIPAADYAQAQKSSYPYVTEMNVDKTLYTISLAVEDVPGETISYIQFEKEIR